MQKYDIKFEIFKEEGQEERKKRVQGKWKKGDQLIWDDYFYFNLKDLVRDYLFIFFYEEERFVGCVELPYKTIKRQFKVGTNCKFDAM